MLALPLLEVSAKVRTGGVIDEPEDFALPHWAGVVPMRLVAGAPQPDAGVTGRCTATCGHDRGMSRAARGSYSSSGTSDLSASGCPTG